MSSILFSLTIPAFLLLVWIEYQIAKRKNLLYFNFSSSVSNLTIGIAERLSELFLVGISFSVFDFLHKNIGIFEIHSSVWTFMVLLFITDFVWYWYHRSSHRINLFWAAHIVHHQSEDFNYTVSARITMFQSAIRILFWCILPILGFPAEMVVAILLIHGVYPFFVHTRVIGKLGILEKILVTPSHHRVHHASNEKYLDKNFGSVFIIWDKLFGTFAEEKEEPVYGLTSQLKSHSFLWQHFHYYLELWEASKPRKGLVRKMQLLFGPPEIIIPTVRKKLELDFLPSKKVIVSSAKFSMRNYNLIQMAFSFAVLIILGLKFSDTSSIIKLGLTAVILITVINICAILEQRTWIIYLEYLRVLVILSTAVFYFKNIYFYASALVFVILIFYFFNFLKKRIISFIYGAFFYRRIISA